MKVIELNLPFKIVCSSVAKPSRSFSNIEILQRIPEFSEKSNYYLQAADRRIQESFGYENRYLSFAPQFNYDDGLTSEDLAVTALRQCLIQADIQPELLIHGTTTSSRYTSTQAAGLAQKMDSMIPAFEVKAGCASGMVAMQSAFMWMSQGYDSALMVVAETLSRVQSPLNPSSGLGLADAAAALMLQRTPANIADFTCEKILYYTDGSAADLMTSRVQLPLKKGSVVEHEFSISGNEALFQEKAQFHYQNMIRTLLPEQSDRDSIQWVLSHQVNRSLIEHCLNECHLHAQALWINKEYGNIGSVSIPALLHHFHTLNNQFQSRDRLLLITVGGGMNCQAQLWRKN